MNYAKLNACYLEWWGTRRGCRSVALVGRSEEGCGHGLLRGEPTDAVSRDVAVPIYKLQQWRDRTLAGIVAGSRNVGAGWIMKHALSAWIDQEEEWSRVTRVALLDVDSGSVVDHQAVKHGPIASTPKPMPGQFNGTKLDRGHIARNAIARTSGFMTITCKGTTLDRKFFRQAQAVQSHRNPL